MKIRYLLSGIVFLIATSIGYSQQDDGARVFTGSQTTQTAIEAGNNYLIQVGLPLLGQNRAVTAAPATVERYSIRFPWDVIYVFNTFELESFDVSKGYFGDKVLVNWELRNNFDLITTLKLFRREYTDDDSGEYQFVANVAPSTTQYEDLYVEGGILYEYKLTAAGVSNQETEFVNFITGIGFRNPTAVVTGNVNFKGGNPVKDVTLRARSSGSDFNFGSGLRVLSDGALVVDGIAKPVTDKATLQAWFKPVNAYTDDSGTATQLFQMKSGSESITATVNYLAASNNLVVSLDGSVFTISNYIPSGAVNSRGNDILAPLSTFNTTFTHFSFQLEDGTAPRLFINGRPMTAAYQVAADDALRDVDTNYKEPFFALSENGIPTDLTASNQDWSAIEIGGARDAFIDEIRVFKSLKSDKTIRSDYSRYISGNDAAMIVYLRANESVGNFAYDLSRNGFNFNKNNGRLDANGANKVLWETVSENFPNESQLGILGITDDNGNYEITAIPYTGTGESFTITPLFGQHEFDPNQQLVFLGQGSEVVNQINFIDISAFNFNGKILYDTRGVFSSLVELNGNSINNLNDGDQYVSGPGILDEGYNFYEKSGIKYPKGEYWYNTNEDRLERYGRVGLEGANVFIDGDVVLDENNFPVVSDAEGEFSIDVPIGNHFITVKKNGHEFTAQGRFPAAEGSLDEFFENRIEQTYFIDTTRVTVVGRVVGGSVEAAKPIGFGQDGIAATIITNDQDQNETIRYSSKNNIGQASITLGHKPATGNITNATRFQFMTQEDSGEYRVEMMPLQYEITQFTGVDIATNATISLPESSEVLNFKDIPESTIPSFELPDNTVLLGEPYEFEKSFVYRSVPVLKVTEQESDAIITVDDNDFSTDGFGTPVYTQFQFYNINLSNFERYTNEDSGTAIEDLVPIIDGELLITNNLALDGSETVVRDQSDQSLITYRFRGGKPAIAPPFSRTIDITYRLNGVDYPAEDYVKDGIMLGGESDGSLTQVTAAPDVPDIILRDPPGSSSSATISAGTSIAISQGGQFTSQNSIITGVKNSFGLKVMFGGGLLGPVTEVKPVANVELGLTLTHTSDLGENLTKTYTFNQSISTSSSPSFVGSEGDLYIGNSVNYSYGTYDNIQSIGDNVTNDPSITLTNNSGETVEIGKRKAFYFVEEPSETFFVYSQKFIINTLIPQLQSLIDGLDNGSIDPNGAGVLTREQYQDQIYLWRKTIQRNERSKFLVKTKPGAAQAAAVAAADDQGFNEDVQQRVREDFKSNISFDSGVGQVTRSVNTNIVTQRTEKLNFKLEASVAAELGLTLNGVGWIKKIGGKTTNGGGTSTGSTNSNTTSISYTLKDNDKDNVLSVDVYNMFDGYGPVFSTLGGATSCPYEGPEVSVFYDDATFDSNNEIVEPLPEGTGELLAFGTQQIEKPGISVEVARVSNIPEDTNAEFLLLLENNSATETDRSFLLTVDNTTNPNNAITNIGTNGTVVSVPFGEKVEFALTVGKSISSINDYEDIAIVIQSLCESGINDRVLVSASFVPSCSQVSIDAPLDNFSYNRDIAFNLDGTSNDLNIQLGRFNTTFNSFEKIDLEYRKATSPTWTRLQTYYTTQAFLDAAIANSETEVSLITTPQLNFGFDITGLNLSDGEYEIRAKSSCTNGTEFISEPVTGRIDLSSPQKFGTPFPINGIYATGTDLKARFSEDIFYNSAVSLLEIKGQTNQLPITNEVSLLFAGASNTMTIESPRIANGDLSIEFWMNNQTVASNAVIMQQVGGIDLRLENGDMVFSLAGSTVRGAIANDGLFHHYTLTYNADQGSLKIIEEDRVLNTTSTTIDAPIVNNNNIVIGGNSFVGNLSQIRFWNKALTLEDSFAMIYSMLIGNESGLTAYYPLDEGRGSVAKDKARFKDAVVTADWDIKPKGNSYTFDTGAAITLDQVGFAQLTPTMDATISFWMKTDVSQEATIFSNGKGDGTDPDMPGGFDNKWSIDLSSNGNLSFISEGINLPITNKSVVDDRWHHVSLRLNRNGSLRTYVDQTLATTNSMTGIGGLSGNTAYLGAQGAKDLAGIETIERNYQGQLDEFRLWNTLRTNDQENRDAFEEIDPESIGLMIYSRFNAPDPLNGNGPRYFHAFRNNTVIPSNAVLQNGTVAYSDDSPAIKPARQLIKIPVNYVINGDEIILEPQVNSFAEIEGQILDITVHRLFDAQDNQQQSPVTWSVFVQKNDVDWFAEGYDEDVIDITKNFEEEEQFELTIINRGGANQPYTISNIPSWLTLSRNSGTVSPASQITITATINALLDPGVYSQDLRLSTDFGLDQIQLLNVRVLGEAPDWTVDPTQFEHSMNIVGILRIDDIISEDKFDMVAAFSNGEVRGVTTLEYDASYQQSFSFLTLYSNQASGESITFKAWDASTGDIVQLDLNGNSNLSFLTNGVVGSLNQPAVFSNTNITEKEIPLNAGWNWVSLNTEDSRFSNLDDLTSNMDLKTEDRILSHSPARLDTYFANEDGTGNWSGSITNNGGVTSDFMYKMRFANAQTLKLSGPKVDVTSFSFTIKENWNWLPFPLTRNVQVSQALANFNPTAGDVIKSQNLFAIYDQLNGWSGTLNFLQEGRGYMIKATTGQEFTYPASITPSSRMFNGETPLENERMEEQYFEYPENMNAVVQLPEGYDNLFIYDDQGVLKGFGTNQLIGDRQLTFITIYGNATENLTYYVGDGTSGIIAAENLLEFRSNKILGKVDSPVVLKLGSDEVVTTFNTQLKIYPNPFSQQLDIETYSDGTQATTIQLISVQGRLVFEKKMRLIQGVNSTSISPDIASGPYFLKVTHGSSVEMKKVIKN